MAEKKSKLRHIPNILSMLRIPFSIALLFLGPLENYWPFLICYAVAGVADVLDGLLARRFHWESELGAKMDSVGDTVFLVCAITAAILTMDFHFEIYNFIALAVLSVLRIGNMVFTKAKFGRIAYIHSLFVKYSTIPIFFLLPLCIVRRELLNFPLLLMVIVVILACLEETWMLAEMNEYDVDMKSIRHLRKYKKNKPGEAGQPKEEINV